MSGDSQQRNGQSGLRIQSNLRELSASLLVNRDFMKLLESVSRTSVYWLHLLTMYEETVSLSMAVVYKKISHNAPLLDSAVRCKYYFLGAKNKFCLVFISHLGNLAAHKPFY